MINPTPPLTYWTEFPVTYRTEQVATVMKWVMAGESGAVIGASGSGKSNLLGFLSSRPDAITSLLIDGPGKYCFLYLDVNSLPAVTAPFFYRGMVQAVQEAMEALDAEVQQTMQQLTQSQINWMDSFAVLSILQKAHRLLTYRGGKKVIWLLDRFDEACRRLDAQTLSSLRSLRDQFKGRLCYLVTTRRPLARLRDPAEIDEFHEIIAANACWIGPMVERDAWWMMQQMAERLQTTFSESEVQKLIEVSGGLPAFMKLACLALAEGDLPPKQSSQFWAQQLLARPEFQRHCQEIWGDLSVEEQKTLVALSIGANEVLLAPDTLAYLEQTGLLVRVASDTPIHLFSPIFEIFITRQESKAAGVIELHPKTRAVLRGGVALEIELTQAEDRLLAYFLEHVGEMCEKDILLRAIWPDEKIFEGISDDRLAQLVRRLREKIEPEPARPSYIQTVRGRGYRFVQPTK